MEKQANNELKLLLKEYDGSEHFMKDLKFNILSSFIHKKLGLVKR